MELHEPAVLAGNVLAGNGAGVVLFSSGEPALVASRVLAQALASAGVSTLVLPLRAGTPAAASTLIEIAPSLCALFAPTVVRERVAFLGLGLGAGSALRAVVRTSNVSRVVLAFTSLDLATRVADDAATAKWLGVVSAQERTRIGAELGGALASVSVSDLGNRRVLLLAAHNEARLPVPEQEALAKQFSAELWWHEGSVRSLAKDASLAARRIVEFLAP